MKLHDLIVLAGPLGFEPRTSGSAGQRPIQTRPRALRKDGGRFPDMKFSAGYPNRLLNNKILELFFLDVLRDSRRVVSVIRQSQYNLDTTFLTS